jgi:hypothetical protein
VTRSVSPLSALALAAALLQSSACGSRRGVPTAEVRGAIAASIHGQGDTLRLTDPRSGQPVALRFDHVHADVKETPGGRYLACVDFRSATGSVYDVDYYVAGPAGTLQVQDVVMHQTAGQTVIVDSMRARLDSAR